MTRPTNSILVSVMVLFAALAWLMATPRPAMALLTGNDVTVTFSQSGVGSFTDTVHDPGSIVGGDSTMIGSNVLVTGESILLSDASFTYHIFGGGNPVSMGSSYLTTNYGPDAQFVFSISSFTPPASAIVHVNVGLTDVIGVALGSQVFFTGTSVTLDVGSSGLGVLTCPTNCSNLGTIALNLQVAPTPEPSTLVLLASSVGLLAVLGLRRGQIA